PALERAAAVQEIEQLLGKESRAIRADSVAQGHLLEGKQHAVPGSLLDSDGAGGNLGERPAGEQGPELPSIERLLPALVRLPLVITLPVKIRRIAETLGKRLEKLPPDRKSTRLNSSH